MKIWEELFDYPDCWKTSHLIKDLNETIEEFGLRRDYLRSIEPNSKASEGTSIVDEIKLGYKIKDEFRRIQLIVWRKGLVNGFYLINRVIF